MSISAATIQLAAKFLKRQPLLSKPQDISELSELVSGPASEPRGSMIFKGFGNTGASVENGDYRIIPNSSNELVIQYYTSGAWDTNNETILATPS